MRVPNMMVLKVAQRAYAILELSTLTDMSVEVCADIISNTAQENGASFLSAAFQLKQEALKGKESRGQRHKRKGRGKSTR